MFPLSPSHQVNGTFAAVLDQMNADFEIGSPIARKAPNEKLDKYLDSLLKNLVDDVCIFHKKREELEREYKKDQNKFELEHIPQRSVPFSFDPADPHYRALTKVELTNERGNSAGIFGWCFVCRGTANLYCKETRIPVCTIDCKLKHLEDLGISY